MLRQLAWPAYTVYVDFGRREMRRPVFFIALQATCRMAVGRPHKSRGRRQADAF